MYTCSVLFHRIPQCRTSTQSMQFTQHVQPTPPVDFILHQEVHNSYIKSYRHWNLNWLYVNENRSTRAKCLDLLCWLVLSVCIYLYCKMCSILFKFNFLLEFFWVQLLCIFFKDMSGKVRVWDTVNKEHILKNEYQPFAGEVKDIAWSGDSQRIAAGGQGNQK